MSRLSMSAQEKQWRAESDARIIKESGLIQSDKQRYNEATALLKKEQQAITNVLNSKSTKAPAKKSPSKRTSPMSPKK